MGIKTASEVFADRTYQAGGTLTPRSAAGALLTDPEAAVRQVIRMVREGKVASQQGDDVSIRADTVCIHGDGPHAVPFARRIHAALTEAGIRLTATNPIPHA